jgi:hypothetical protein
MHYSHIWFTIAVVPIAALECCTPIIVIDHLDPHAWPIRDGLSSCSDDGTIGERLAGLRCAPFHTLTPFMISRTTLAAPVPWHRIGPFR